MSLSRVLFRIGDPLKTSRSGNHISELTFDAYAPNKRLCECTTVTCYLRCTSTIRGTNTRFFLSSRPPFNVASRDTLQRWTKDLLQAAGIDLKMFSSHSTRSAASRKAALKLPLSTLIFVVRRSNECTFTKTTVEKPALFA